MKFIDHRSRAEAARLVEEKTVTGGRLSPFPLPAQQIRVRQTISRVITADAGMMSYVRRVYWETDPMAPHFGTFTGGCIDAGSRFRT